MTFVELKKHQLRLVAWEITRSCAFACKHCRGSSLNSPYAEELTTSECFAVIDSIASMGRCILILTGGEPLLRKDIFTIAGYATHKGLHVALATCGHLLNQEKCKELQDVGIQRISFSIDGATAETHDAFRGVKGAFDTLLRSIEIVKKASLPFQINTTLTKSTMEELPKIFELSKKIGAISFHPFFLVPIGRGSLLMEELISAEDYENVLAWVADKQQSADITIKPTCAPHFQRIYRHLYGVAQKPPHIHRHATHGFETMTRGCLGGHGFAFISHTGAVQICGFLEIEAGSLRKNNFDMSDIWNNAPLLKQLRNPQEYQGKCGLCEYWTICGGCRARAFSMTGEYLGEEPLCLYKPQKNKQLLYT